MIITFGKEQYQWHPAAMDGYANPDGPAVTSIISGGAGATYMLPPASLTVLRGSAGVEGAVVGTAH